MKKKDIKITLVTNGGDYAKNILLKCSLNGINIHSVLILKRKKKSPIKIIPKIISLLMKFRLKVLLSKFFIKIGNYFDKSTYREDISFEGYAKKIIVTGDLNSHDMILDLQKINPDYMILGGVGILKEKVLKIPKYGTINAHPGILPFARGLDVVANSIIREIPIGSTLHYVDSGIDTGKIINRKLLPISNTKNIKELNEVVYQQCSELIVNCILNVYNGKEMKGFNQVLKFPYCKKLSKEQKKKTEDLIIENVPQLIYENWFKRYRSNTLPENLDTHPNIKVEKL